MIIDDLKQIVKKTAPKVNVDNMTEDSRLLEDLRLDSLSVLMMSMGVEEFYGIHFEEFVPFKTVKDVIDYLKKLGIEDK